MRTSEGLGTAVLLLHASGQLPCWQDNRAACCMQLFELQLLEVHSITGLIYVMA
jgi:hypothetical protein